MILNHVDSLRGIYGEIVELGGGRAFLEFAIHDVTVALPGECQCRGASESVAPGCWTVEATAAFAGDEDPVTFPKGEMGCLACAEDEAISSLIPGDERPCRKSEAQGRIPGG